MEFPPGVLAAFGLYLVRTSALVLFSPILGQVTAASGYKLSLIACLSLLLFSAGGEALPEPVGPIAYGAMALRELLIGLFLAFLLHLVVLSVRVAGGMIGQEMGFSMSQQVDPGSGIRTALVTRIYETFFLLGLLAVDGHHGVLRSLAASFERAPVGRVQMASGMAAAVQELFAEMFAAGLTFAAPVMVFLALVSVLMGLLARAVPQLNVLEIGFILRIGLALVAMATFAPTLAPTLEHTYAVFASWLERALDVLGD